ncbi:Ankyrin repeat-containing domain [Penicillium roqueforti FM164]|uniref:Ankyrin repeat-containing domain n=1 Tax=Penicillium roqueforti (strain FM164) TaxID=1365484 RepID=W6QRD8_PENRF|nr:Ankyrin repeat-containing domain [Penicillium roqueforti FM164]
MRYTVQRIDLKHDHGQIALHFAAFVGRIGFVHLLLSSGSSPDLQDDLGHSPWD